MPVKSNVWTGVKSVFRRSKFIEDDWRMIKQPRGLGGEKRSLCVDLIAHPRDKRQCLAFLKIDWASFSSWCVFVCWQTCRSDATRSLFAFIPLSASASSSSLLSFYPRKKRRKLLQLSVKECAHDEERERERSNLHWSCSWTLPRRTSLFSISACLFDFHKRIFLHRTSLDQWKQSWSEAESLTSNATNLLHRSVVNLENSFQEH